jgi:hypothetical protein
MDTPVGLASAGVGPNGLGQLEDGFDLDRHA